ncbi:MAG: (2Fe-2S) ferredoxin domain-containing protein [Clostridia bacterium]
MKIFVCIGSSCHLRGSYGIIELMKKAIAENNLSDKVELSGAFCLGHCTQHGVSVRFDDEIVSGITPENFDGIFMEKVLNRVRN